MPNLTRQQAAEQSNRLFPGLHWTDSDMGLYSVSFESPVGRPISLRMWLPILAPDIERIARYRLNLDGYTDIKIARQREAEAKLSGDESGRHSPSG